MPNSIFFCRCYFGHDNNNKWFAIQFSIFVVAHRQHFLLPWNVSYASSIFDDSGWLRVLIIEYLGKQHVRFQLFGWSTTDDHAYKCVTLNSTYKLFLAKRIDASLFKFCVLNMRYTHTQKHMEKNKNLTNTLQPVTRWNVLKNWQTSETCFKIHEIQIFSVSIGCAVCSVHTYGRRRQFILYPHTLTYKLLLFFFGETFLSLSHTHTRTHTIRWYLHLINEWYMNLVYLNVELASDGFL